MVTLVFLKGLCEYVWVNILNFITPEGTNERRTKTNISHTLTLIPFHCAKGGQRTHMVSHMSIIIAHKREEKKKALKERETHKKIHKVP